MSPPPDDDATPTSRSADPATPGTTDATDAAGTTNAGGGVGGLLPEASVESRWWYWIAAVPVYFGLSLVLGGLLFGVFFLGLWVDVGFAFSGAFAFVLLGLFLALPGLLLSVLFPVAVYVDARAVREANVRWNPDPALYGLVALAGVLVTAFTVSVPMALYYLYRRHEAMGVP